MTGLHAVLTSLVSQASPSGGCAISPNGARVNGLCSAGNSLHIPVEYRSILPVLVLTIGALLLLTVSAVLPKRSWPG